MHISLLSEISNAQIGHFIVSPIFHPLLPDNQNCYNAFIIYLFKKRFKRPELQTSQFSRSASLFGPASLNIRLDLRSGTLFAAAVFPSGSFQHIILAIEQVADIRRLWR